jgi:hypothetical protein
MAIHAVQACLPETRVLPASVACITRRTSAHGSAAVVEAHEVARGDGRYVFDVTVRDGAGRVLETLAGLELRRSPSAARFRIPPSLVATAVERRLLDAELGTVRIWCGPRSGIRWPARADGKPLSGASRTYAGPLELRCDGATAHGIDAAFLDAATSESWRYATAAFDDLAACARELGAETADEARARAWCALEAAKKAGPAPPSALGVRGAHDGVIVFTTGAADVATMVLGTTLSEAPLVVAIALAASHRALAAAAT